MNKTLKKYLKKIIIKLVPEVNRYYNDYTNDEINIIDMVSPFTMTSHERILSVIRSVEYIINNNIPGDIVECGVWKGGSMMAAAYTLLKHNVSNRKLYLYDTYEGMPAPEDIDKKLSGFSAKEKFESRKSDTGIGSDWCLATIDEVKSNLYKIGYDKDNMIFIKGKVEDTIPENAPEKISLLRLDTDWYASSKHELVHLFPRLSVGGVLIIDDYGTWEGARKAVDEYLKENNIKMFLQRIDPVSTISVKVFDEM